MVTLETLSLYMPKRCPLNWQALALCYQASGGREVTIMSMPTPLEGYLYIKYDMGGYTLPQIPLIECPALPTTVLPWGALPRQWDSGALGEAPGRPAAKGVSPYSSVPRGPGKCSSEHWTWCFDHRWSPQALAIGLEPKIHNYIDQWIYKYIDS